MVTNYSCFNVLNTGIFAVRDLTVNNDPWWHITICGSFETQNVDHIP